MKFANIYDDKTERLSLGDAMQLLAIQNLYHDMGIAEDEIVRIPFKKLSVYDGEYVILPVSFPFYAYMEEERIFAFSPKIIPVFLGISIMASILDPEDVAYLRRYEPVGCRDVHTLNVLRKNNIMAYLGGCITATFPNIRMTEKKRPVQREKVFFIDFPEELKKYVPKQLLDDGVFLSHTVYPGDIPDGPERKIRELYEQYIQEARLVVTTRLHAALPCMAAGIPVVWLKDHYSFRFVGADAFIHIYSEGEYADINWNPGPVYFEEEKEKLRKLAKKRLRDAFDKYRAMFDVSAVLEKNKSQNYWIEFVSNTIKYIEKNIDKEQFFNYVLWGCTQTARSIYEYLEKNYPNSRLVCVIDKNKRIRFCGVETQRKEWLDENKGTFCFVCTGAAIREAEEYFYEIHYRNYYQCCLDGNPHMMEMRQLKTNEREES